MFIRNIIIGISLCYSLSIFACSVDGEMAASRLFQQGLTNKLASEALYSNFEVKKIVKVAFPNTYDVSIEDESSDRCVVLNMRSYGTGSCEFTADILSEASLNCDQL